MAHHALPSWGTAQDDEASAIQAFLEGRTDRLSQRVGRHGNNAQRLSDYRSSLDSSQRLSSFNDALSDITSSVALTRQVNTVLDMMEQEVIWSASLDASVDWLASVAPQGEAWVYGARVLSLSAFGAYSTLRTGVSKPRRS